MSRHPFSFFITADDCLGRPNIPLSAVSPAGRIPDLNRHTPYIPPHPQRGTKYHRYTLLLLPQESYTNPISVPPLSDKERLGFDVREFIRKYGLDRRDGGGIHMWREVWDEKVSKIYKDFLSKASLTFFFGIWDGLLMIQRRSV